LSGVVESSISLRGPDLPVQLEPEVLCPGTLGWWFARLLTPSSSERLSSHIPPLATSTIMCPHVSPRVCSVRNSTCAQDCSWCLLG
jgi:hypothetical protein